VNSHMWHEFTLTREEDVLDYSLAAQHARGSTLRVSYCPDDVSARTLECFTPEPSDVDSFDEPSPTRTQKRRKHSGKKRRREIESCSPLTRKIYIMQQQLHDLIEERATSKRIRASNQHTSRDNRKSNLVTKPETSDWEDRRADKAASKVQYVLEKDVKRKDRNSKVRGPRTSRPKAR
jgi:hypothetical protein